MDMTYASAAQYLRGQDDFLILTHKNPDGDTVGCAVALCLALRDLGKRAQILENPGFTARYAPYLEGLCTEKPSSPACIVAVDIADEKLFPKPALAYCSQVAFAVDHHASHRNYAERALVDAGAAACGELVYRLILALGVRLRPQLAQALYIAISTDTSCFLNANTTPETHRIAAELMSAEIDFEEIHREFFVVKSKARLTIESKLIEGMHFYQGGRVAVMRVTRDLLRGTGATEDDLDNISALARAVEGVDLGILIRELSDGRSKLSMRSSSAVDVAKLCERFGGGGHVRAAGCTIDAPPEQAEERVCAVIESIGIFSE